MRCIRPGGAAAEESHREKTTPCTAGGGLLAAIAAVLQLVGSAIRFGPFSVSLVLIPLVLGAALYGWGMGCWLGLVFGAVVLLSGGRRPLSGGRSGRGLVTVLSKGIACGAAAGLCCRWLHPRYPRLSILLSALAAPLVNTGGGSAGLPTVFHAPHPSVGAAGGLCRRRSLSDGGHAGCPCTLAITGGLGRFVAPLCRRGPSTTRICCCVACGSAAPLTAHRQISPEKRSRYKRRLGTTSPQPPFFCPTTGRAGLTERTPAPPMRRR